MLQQLIESSPKEVDLTNEGLSEEEFNRLLENIPQNITKRNPDEFTDYDDVRVVDLR